MKDQLGTQQDRMGREELVRLGPDGAATVLEGLDQTGMEPPDDRATTRQIPDLPVGESLGGCLHGAMVDLDGSVRQD